MVTPSKLAASRRYYHRNRAKCLEAGRKWRAKNRAKARRSVRNYYYKNRTAQLTKFKAWRTKNPDIFNASRYLSRDKLKLEVLMHYSLNGVIECVKCKISDIDVLCLDHINDDGAAHRRQLKIAQRGRENGGGVYAVLKKHGFPPGLQVLCANCNMKKQMERHRAERMKNPVYAKRINAALQLSA